MIYSEQNINGEDIIFNTFNGAMFTRIRILILEKSIMERMGLNAMESRESMKNGIISILQQEQCRRDLLIWEVRPCTIVQQEVCVMETDKRKMVLL